MSIEIGRFAVPLSASDQHIAQASKDEVAGVARVLALHVANYRTRFGGVPIEESLNLLTVEKLIDEMAKVLANGSAKNCRTLRSLNRAFVKFDTELTRWF